VVTFLRFALAALGFTLCSFRIYAAEPCLSAEKKCTEWIDFHGGGRSLVYRTYALGQKNEAISRVLIMVHGASRDADNYFRTTLAAGFLARALEDTLIVAPRFASNNDRTCHDKLDTGEVNWSCNGDSWRSGGDSETRKGLTSFDFMDDLLKMVADKDKFPNLKSIVLTGHSAGGQFVTRYQMVNQVNDKLPLPIQYIVSNPSSYAYPVPDRPAADGAMKPFTDGRNCTTYDNWPYGFKNRSGYSARLSDAQLTEQLTKRPAIYLLGEIDILPLGGFDSSCPAMAQGSTRLARGQAFQKLVTEKFKVDHKVVTVPLCGHNARCMFTSETALPLIFPKQ
jgi:hypothetical protein